MSPDTNELRLPPSVTLRERDASTPRAEERPTLRFGDRVLAVLDLWTPLDVADLARPS